MVTEFWDPVERLHSIFKERNKTISVAESCTGGLLGGALTSIPGSSSVFSGGIIAYNNSMKQELLDVSPSTLEEDGAVSDATAMAMSRGARSSMDTDCALSITGIAGPTGGSEEKPVGLVFFGLNSEEHSISSQAQFEGDRASIRKKSVNYSLEFALDQFDQE